MKKIISLALLVVMIATFGATQAFAATNDDISLMYVNTTSISSTLSISSKTAQCKSSVIGNSNCTKIVVTQKLQKKSGDSWVKVETWTKTFNGKVANYANSKGSLASGTYRVRTVAKVYNGSSYETVTKNSATKTC